MKRLWIPAMLALALAALVVPAQAGAVTFPDGVASGDVTSTRAVLWTRVDTATNIKVEGWTNAALSGPKAFQGKMKTSAARDLTVKIDQGGPDAEHAVLVSLQEGRGGCAGRYVQDRAGGEHLLGRRLHVERRLRRIQGRRRQPVQQLGDADRRAERERRLLHLPRRHDLLGLEQPSGRPGHTLADYRERLQAPAHVPEPAGPAGVDVDVPADRRPRGPERLRRSDGRPGALRGRAAGVHGEQPDPRDRLPARPVVRGRPAVPHGQVG